MKKPSLAKVFLLTALSAAGLGWLNKPSDPGLDSDRQNDDPLIETIVESTQKKVQMPPDDVAAQPEIVLAEDVLESNSYYENLSTDEVLDMVAASNEGLPEEFPSMFDVIADLGEEFGAAKSGGYLQGFFEGQIDNAIAYGGLNKALELLMKLPYLDEDRDVLYTVLSEQKESLIDNLRIDNGLVTLSKFVSDYSGQQVFSRNSYINKFARDIVAEGRYSELMDGHMQTLSDEGQTALTDEIETSISFNDDDISAGHAEILGVLIKDGRMSVDDTVVQTHLDRRTDIESFKADISAVQNAARFEAAGDSWAGNIMQERSYSSEVEPRER